MKELKSGTNNIWHEGDTVWACAYTFNKENTMLYFQKPIKGMLTRTTYPSPNMPDKTGKAAIYFVPLRTDGKGLAWSKGVKVMSRHYADTEEECNELYNMLVQRRLDWLEEQKAKCLADIIPGATGLKGGDAN